MSREFQIDRRTKLWEEKTRLARRVVYGGLLFGGLILANVLTPYSNDLGAALLEQTIILY